MEPTLVSFSVRFHFVGVSEPLLSVHEHYIFFENYDLQLSDFDLQTVFLQSVDTLPLLLRFASIFNLMIWTS